MESIWRRILSSSSSQRRGVFLVEHVDSNVSLHLLCVYAHILSTAKELVPVFLVEESRKPWVRSIVERYFEQFQLVEKPVLPKWKRLSLLVMSCSLWFLLLLKKDLVTLRWRGQLVGDIIYDQYLASCFRGTVYYRDVRLLKTIYNVISYIEAARLTFQKVNPRAMLLSHLVGLSSAPLAVASAEYGVPVYIIAGGSYGTLTCPESRKDYMYTATPEELKPLLELPEDEFDRLFEAIKEELFLGDINPPSKLAFANKLFTRRSDFASVYGLDVAKKNVFVMLHAFTDYPHTHFKGMLFKDFLDWFLRTLEFASNEKSVNWIIKQHPVSHFYPVEDFDWDGLRRKYSSDNILFMPHDEPFDSRSICHVGDAVVTCLGSAGFEFSALGGIPSVTAGDNPYADSGFAIYPQSQQEYFDVLHNIGGLERLVGESLRRAKAAFMFIHRLSKVPMHAVVYLSHFEHRKLQFGNDYFEMTDANAIENEALIANELVKYVNAVAQPDFRALRTTPKEYWEAVAREAVDL